MKKRLKCSTASIVFSSKTNCLMDICILMLQDKNGEKNEGPITQDKLVNDLLHPFDTDKSMGPGGVHLRVPGLELVKCSLSHFPSLIKSTG